MGSTEMIAEFIIDLRAAWVGLKHSRMVLVTASLVLGLGLAATVYMQTVTNTFYFKPPPFLDSERLYRVFGRHELTREIHDELSFPNYVALREADEVEDAAAVTWTSAVVTGEGIAQSFEAAEVTTNFFDLIGVQPMLGRTFAQRDGMPGAEPTAVLSGELWSSRYASDESIVGRRVTISGESRTIVGVLAPGFGLIGGEDIWLPIQRDASSTDRQSETPRYGWVIAKAEPGRGHGPAAERVSTNQRVPRGYPASDWCRHRRSREHQLTTSPACWSLRNIGHRMLDGRGSAVRSRKLSAVRDSHALGARRKPLAPDSTVSL
jgi:hypothetical protein